MPVALKRSGSNSAKSEPSKAMAWLQCWEMLLLLQTGLPLVRYVRAELFWRVGCGLGRGHPDSRQQEREKVPLLEPGFLEPCTEAVARYGTHFSTPSFPEPLHIPNSNSEPSTLDSQSSTTLFLSSEEQGPSTAALPSPSSSSCEPQAFSPGPPVLPALLPPLPAASAPPGPGTSRRAGLYSVVASSPEAAPRLVDWLPGYLSTTSPATRGDDRERPPPVLAPAQGLGRSCALRPGAAGREEGTVDAGSSPPPRARPAAAASLEANVGDILVELRTMNGHLGVIARALTKLASSLGPQPEPLPDAPDAN
ncbi:proline-rich receptor-like protein kinase PERK2 [Cebus imitator]|uniref:proline-rich receptor-like protein kinase PERK2 n=1 Tax=Cebus imitator TaxID=2715852 RepID=UPI0018992E27|nr:proline-rich receptor-like protein kinase PERK2 [Cebus imitator]